MMMPLLDSSRFTRLARGGIGRRSSAIAAAMTVFEGAVYVGTDAVNVGLPPQPPRLLRLDPAGEWSVVFEAPLQAAPDRALMVDADVATDLVLALQPDEADDGAAVPLDVGYTAFAVFQGTSDTAPTLYVGTASYGGARLLRSVDGQGFEPVGGPGLGAAAAYAVAGLAVHGGRLFAILAGTVDDAFIEREVAPAPVVLVSDDPAAGIWQEACLPGFGDAHNVAITALGLAGEHLYAGTANGERGFQLWRTRAEGEAPFDWERVLVDGAFAFNHSPAAGAMTAFDGALYVGSRVPGTGYGEAPALGADAAELIRVQPDGSWDLVIGRPRFTPVGLKVPLGLMGPGFDDPYNAGIASLCVHEGALYLGTRHWGAFAALDDGAAPVVGGYQLWASGDGVEWELVLEDGAGNPGEVALTALLSTPDGLLAATGNVQPLLSILAQLKERDIDIRERAGFEILRGA